MINMSTRYNGNETIEMYTERQMQPHGDARTSSGAMCLCKLLLLLILARINYFKNNAPQ